MNKFLVGNGTWCTTGKGTGRGKPGSTMEYESGLTATFHEPCPACKGKRRLAAEPAAIIAGSVKPNPELDPCTILIANPVYAPSRP